MKRFKVIFTWIVGIAFVLYAGFIFIWFTKLGINHDIWKIIMDQWLAMIVFPSACFAALVVVMLLDQASGDIEFKVWKFEFKGAAAPLVMWGMLMFIIAVSLNILWQPAKEWRSNQNVQQENAAER